MPWVPRRVRTIGVMGVLLVAAAMCGGVRAEEPAGAKALKYHELLVARPEPGYLFDRFYNTWLDQSTVDALEEYLTQRATDSHDTADQLLLAFFYVKKGDDVAALEEFNAALAANPASAATWYHKALVEARTLDFDAAVADLRTARDRSPDDKLVVRIDKQLGKLLVRNRQTDEALKVWRALLDAHPADDELCEDLIELEIDEGLFSQAAELAQSLIARTKDPYLGVMRRLRLGDIHHRAGQRDKAIAVYTSALDDVGSESWLEREILAQIDQVMRREDDVSGLKRLLDDLVRKHPKRIAIHRRRAQLLLELGENEAALAAFREVLKLTPGDQPTREQYVAMLAKTGDYDGAVKELNSLCEQHAQDAELRFRLAHLLEDAKRPDEAAAAADEYLAVSDGSEYAYLRAARLLARFENKRAARGVFDRLAEKFPDSPSAQDAYAAFLYTQGEKEEAIRRWRSLAAGAEVGQVLRVARTLSARGEHAVALEVLRDREADFAKEPLFLGQLVGTAVALKKYDDALPWALTRVELAETTSDLETAVDQAVNVVERADKLLEIARREDARADRSIPETCLLAELWERIGDSRRADAVLAQPAAAGHLLAVSEQIRLHSQRRDWTAAAAATRRMLELPGGRKSLYVRRLVELYQRDFQLEEGLKWIQEWKRLSPGSTTPWVTEARMLSALGRSDDALTTLRAAVLKFDDDEELRVRLAEFYSQSGKYADAERIYWQLYEQTPDLGGKLRWAQELGRIAQRQGTVKQIVENFQERAANNRRSIVPLLSLAEVYRQADDYEGRRRALTAAAKIKPDDLYLLMQIARAEEQDGQWQAAVATLERAAPLDKTGRVRRQIAQLHLQYGDEETGFAMLLDLAAGAEADPRAVETAADALCAMDEWERAAKFLQQRIVDYPADYRLRYLMAVAQEEAGQTDAAVEEFIRLLDDQEELPGKKSPTASGLRTTSGYYGMMAQLMPARAAEWFESMQYRYSAYAYRQQRGQRVVLPSSLSGASMRSTIQLPSRVEMVRPMAMSHALSIAGMLDDDRQQEVCDTLESHGIWHAKALSTVDPLRGDVRTALTEILEEDPNDETALAIMVLQRMGMQDTTRSSYTQRAVETFRESRPQLAFLAAVQAGVIEAADAAATSEESDASKNKYLDQALDIAATIDAPNPIVVMGATTALGGQPGRSSVSPAISPAYADRFSRLLVDWYPQLVSSQYGSYAFYMVVQTLARNDDPTAYVRFLDEEVGRYQANSAPNARAFAAQAIHYGGNQPTLLAPLMFPPKELAAFPPNVLMLFSTDANRSPFGTPMVPPGGVDQAAAKIKPLLAGVNSPVLRVLLAHQAELDDAVDGGIAKMLAAQTPTIDAYLLAAARAGEQENHAEVVRLLEKARYLPMKQQTRQTVDAAIVAAALAAKDDSGHSSQPADQLVEAGRQASLRLRRARLNPQERNELIVAMEDLGLKKEAAKLDALAAASTASAGSRSSRGVVYYSSGRGAPTATDRVTRLVADGKTDAAVRLLAAEVSSLVQQTRSTPQNLSYYRQQFRELQRRIDSFGLADKVLESLAPGETRNVRRIGEYAMACQLFGKDDLARAEYERGLGLRPKDDQLRMQLIMLIGASDPAAAAEQIEKLGPNSGDMFAEMLFERLQQYDSPAEERIGYAELAVGYIRRLDPADVVRASWPQNMLHVFGRNMYVNRGPNLPSLYAAPTESNASNRRRSGVSAEVLKRRERVHAELCTAMLGHPDLARFGFSHLLAAAEARGEATDDFVDRAKQILLDEAEKSARRGAAFQQQTVYYSGNSGDVRFRTPEEFLARRAWQSGDWSLVDETLLPALDGGRTRQSRERLEQYASLYRCDPAEFVVRAEDAVRSARFASRNRNNEGLAIAVDAWVDRQLDVDLQPLVLRQLKLDVSGPNSHTPPGYLRQFLEGVATRWDRPRQLALVEELATIFVGPPGRRNDFISKNYDPSRISSGTPNARIHAFGRLIEQLCQQSGMITVILEHLQPYNPVPAQNLRYRVENTLREVADRGAEATMEMLAASPWLGDLDQFRPLVVTGGGDRAPLATLLDQITRNEKRRDEFRQLLDQRQAAAPTFGGGLILARLDQGKNKSAVFDYLGDRLEDISALPDDRQARLAVLVSDLVGSEARANRSLSESAAAARQWMIDGRADQSQTLVARVDKARRLEELGIQYGQVDEFLREHLAKLIAADTAGAVKVYQRLCDLSRDAQRHGTWHMGFSSGQSTEGWILNGALQNIDRPDWSAYNFIADAIDNDAHTSIEINWSVNNALDNMVRRALDRVPKGPDNKTRPVEDRLRAVYEELGPALGGRHSSLLIPTLYQRTRGRPSLASLKKIQTWARAEAQRDASAELAADFVAAAGLLVTEKQEQRGGHRPAAGERREMADYHERFHTLLTDVDLPETWRIYLAAFLAERQGASLPLPLAQDIVSLHTMALADRVPILGQQDASLTAIVLSLKDEPAAASALAVWRDAWASRYLSRVRSQSGRPQQFERLDDVSSSGALSRALQVYIAAGEFERVEKLLARYNDRVASMPQLTAILVRAERPVEAARLLRQNWSKLRLRWPNGSDSRYDADLAAQLPAVYDELQRDDLRYFARVFFASMRGANTKQPGDDKAAGELAPRDRRLVELAGELDQVTFADPALKARSLAALCGSKPAGELVTDAVAKQYEADRLVDAFRAGDNDRVRQETELTVCYLGNRLRQGDARPLAELLGQLNSESVEDYQFGQWTTPLVTCCRDALREPGPPLPADQCAALAVALRGMMIGREYVNLQDYNRYGALLLAMHSQAGQCEAATKWIGDVSDYARSQIERHGATEDIWRFGLRLNGPATDENLDARLRYVENALRFAIDRKWTRWHGGQPYRLLGDNRNHYMQRIVDAGLLTADELKQHGQELVDGVDDNDFGAAAWVSWLQLQKEYEQAASAWRPVVERALADIDADPKAEATRHRVSCVAGLGTCLVELGRLDEARDVVTMLDGKDIDEWSEMKQLKQTLAKRAAAAKAAEAAAAVKPPPAGSDQPAADANGAVQDVGEH